MIHCFISALNAVSQSSMIQDVIQAFLLDLKSGGSFFVSVLIKHTSLALLSYILVNMVDAVMNSRVLISWFSCPYTQQKGLFRRNPFP